MKRERLLTFLWAWVISFAMALGIAGCLATAFEFPFSYQLWAALAVGCAAAAALCFFRFGFAAGLAVWGCACVFLWRRGSLSAQLSALIGEITQCYHYGYGWPVFSWEEPLEAQFVTLPFLLIGLFMALVTARVVARRGRTVWPVLAATPFISLCIVLNDTVPATAYIALTLFALITLLMTQTLRRKDALQANRLTAILMLPTLLALAVLFAAVPREGYVPPEKDLATRAVTWFQELEVGQKTVDRVMSFVSGIGKEKVNLKNTGPRGQQKYKVMEVSAETDGLLYLRGRAYDIYDGSQWLASEGAWALDGDYNTHSTFLGDVSIRTQSVHDVLYSPVLTSESIRDQFAGGCIPNPDGLKSYSYPWFARTHGPNYLQTSYLLSSDGTGVTDITSGAEELMEDLAGQYLDLPEDTRKAAEQYLRDNMPRFAEKPTIQQRSELVLTYIDGEKYTLPICAADNVMLEAECIGELVRSSARYDLSTRKMPAGEDDFAMWFLNDSDTGYCVHFATAATVLLRAAGIPARYVEGHMVSTRENKTVAVLGEDAHAWTEYWVPGAGWQLLEATPGYGSSVPIPTEPEETVPITTLPDEDETEPQASTRPDTPDNPDIPDLPSQPQNDPTQPTPGGIPLLPGGDRDGPVLDLTPLFTALKWLAFPAMAAAGLFGQWKLRLRYRKNKLAASPPNRQALLYWRELTRIWRILKESPDEALEDLAQKAKFSQHTLTEEELDSFRRTHAALTDRMRHSGWPAQLLYRLILALY